MKTQEGDPTAAAVSSLSCSGVYKSASNLTLSRTIFIFVALVDATNADTVPSPREGVRRVHSRGEDRHISSREVRDAPQHSDPHEDAAGRRRCGGGGGIFPELQRRRLQAGVVFDTEPSDGGAWPSHVVVCDSRRGDAERHEERGEREDARDTEEDPCGEDSCANHATEDYAAQSMSMRALLFCCSPARGSFLPAHGFSSCVLPCAARAYHE